jgi:hypothetical protein
LEFGCAGALEISRQKWSTTPHLEGKCGHSDMARNLMHLYCGCTIQPPVGDGLRELGPLKVFAPHGRVCSRLLLLKDWLSVDE